MAQSQDKLQPRLRKKYNDVIHNFLSERLKIENKMRIPKISKIVIKMHSKNLHLGVRLHITNDVGQEDEIVIPAFLTTRD